MAGSSYSKNKKSKEVLYSEEFQALLDRLEEEDNYDEEEDEDQEDDEAGGNGSSRRRRRKLRLDQVKALESNFEAERRLGPSRKAAIATELGLEPRQVAVWFQNRRARCKTKQLEREFLRLQAAYNALSRDYDSLDKETQSLVAEVKDLEAKVQATNYTSGCSEDMGSNINVDSATAELVAQPALPQTWWSSGDGYFAGEQLGDVVNGLGWSSNAVDFEPGSDGFSFDQSAFFC